MQLIGVLVSFVFVLLLTYLTTKWIANYQKGHSYNRNLKVIETLKLTNNKYIQIVQVGEVYLVIAIGKDEVTMLTELSKEQLAEFTTEESPSGAQLNESFHDVLDRIGKRLPKK